MRQRYSFSFATIVLLLLTVAYTQGATITSTAAGGNWNAGGTWIGGVVPAAGDAVIIATTGAGAVNITANVTQTAAGSVTVNSGASLTTTLGTITFGSLTINSGGSVTMYRNLRVLGATIIDGTINFGSTNTTVRTMTFSGPVTLNSGAVWNETTTGIAANFAIANNFINDATTFTAQNRPHTFSGTAMTIGGGTPFVFPQARFTGTRTNTGTLTITTSTFTQNFTNNGTLTSTTLTVTGAAIRLTNNGTVTAGTALSGTGGLTQGATGVLNLGGTSAITTLTATTPGNIVNYSGAAQNVKTIVYDNLILSGTGTKTFLANLTINNDLSIEAGAAANLGAGRNHTSLSLHLGGTLQPIGSWGATISSATNKDDTYFTSTTGVLYVNSCITGTWYGLSSDWNDPANWCDGVPTAATDAIIAAGTPFQPSVNSSVSAVCNSLTINPGATVTNDGTLSVSAAITGAGILINGTGSAAILNIGGTCTVTTLTANASGNTVNYAGTAQTIKVTTYNNLTLSGSGAKTFPAGITTVNGTLSMEGTSTATLTGTLAYGASATLQYNTATARTTGPEWLAGFAGNLIIANTGLITTPVAGVFTSGSLTVNSGAQFTVLRPLTINGVTNISGSVNWSSNNGIARQMTFTGDVALNSGSSWIEVSATANDLFAFAGNFTNNSATFTGTSTGSHSFSGTAKTISGSTATSFPNVAITGTYTNTGILSVRTALSGVGALTNSAGGILNIGGSSLITTLDASATGNLVNYTGAAQAAKATTYYNLTLSGSGAKTFATTPTVNNVLSLEGSASVVVTAAGVVTYGPNATLQYNKPANFTATSEEWITPFAASGGVIISNTGTITMNQAKVFNASIPLTINSGASLSTNNFQLTLGGDFINNGGTFTAGSSPIVIANTMASQSIAGFTTTGLVSITKTAGTVTLTGALNTGPLTLNGNGGILSTGSNNITSNGVLTLSANAEIALGPNPHALTFADSHLAAWIAGTALNITGWQGAWDGTSGTAGKIFIGTDASGLVFSQLDQITFQNSYGSLFPAMLLSTGELVPNSTANDTNSYSVSTTFTVPSCVTTVSVEAWGGGGRGSTRTTNGNGGGGGGGAYSKADVPVIPGNTYTVTVGAGSANGLPGGDSWFGTATTIMAKGGNSSPNNNATGATGGQASAGFGTTKFSGATGVNGALNYGGGGGSSAGTAADGNTGVTFTGGTAPAGGGKGGDGRNTTQGNGLAGSIPGGGGGGAYRTSTLTRIGGAGARGKVIIAYTIPVPTIIPGSNPTVCTGTTTANLPITVTAGCPDKYSIEYDAAALTAGFTNVVDATLGASPLVLTIPSGAEAAVYNAILTVKNTSTGFGSSGSPITITLSAPQGSLTGNSVCPGGTGQFTFTASSGTGPYTLVIDAQTYTGITSGVPFDATPAPIVTTNYTLTSITDAGTGCVRTSGITGASATITVYTADQWTGAFNNDWDNPANWSCGLPTSATDVEIPLGIINLPVISAPDAVCNNLTIDQTLTVISGGTLSATSITNTGTFTINPSGRATTGALINNGVINLNSASNSSIFSLMLDSYSGTGTSFIQLFLTGGGAPNYNWHYVAVPVDGLSTTYFLSVAPNLLAYDDSRVVSRDFDGWSWFDGSPDFPPVLGGGAFSTMSFGRGYNFYTSSDANIVFPLMPSLGTTLGSVSLQYSGTTVSDPIFGYNLLGNSLTCSLDWDNVTFSGSVGETVYYTSGNAWVTYLKGAGGTNSATQFIPPLQGFFVKANDKGASIDLSGARVHSSQPRYKKSLSVVEQVSSVEAIVYPKVKLELNGSSTSDETIVWFNDQATIGYDEKYDAIKLFSSNAGSGQLYSTEGGKSYVINGIPTPAGTYIVPLAVKIANSGNYSLLKKVFIAPDGYDILLIDKANNNFTVNLKNSDSYSFASAAGTFADRFILEIKSLSTAIKVEDSETSNNYFNIYSYQSNVNIMPLNSLLSGSKGEIKISDLTGRVVKEVKNVEWYEGSLVQVPYDEQKGIYIVEVTSGAIRQTGKIVLQ